MTNDELNEVRDWLVDSFESGAEWRERKASEYPDDERNMDAHRAHLALRDSVASIPEPLIRSYIEVREQIEPYRVGEIESEAFRTIGFHSAPASAAAFLEDILDELRREAGTDLRSLEPASVASH